MDKQMKTEDRQLDQLTAKWLQQTSQAFPGEPFTSKVMESILTGGIVFQADNKRSKAWWLMWLLLPAPVLIWFIPALLPVQKFLVTQSLLLWHWLENFASSFFSVLEGLKVTFHTPLLLLCSLAALLLLTLDWFFGYRKIHQ